MTLKTELARAIQKHDDMVRALSEMQKENNELKALSFKFLAAMDAVYGAQYWMNKVRTDMDADDADEMMSQAYDELDKVFEEFTKVLVPTPRSTSTFY